MTELARGGPRGFVLQLTAEVTERADALFTPHASRNGSVCCERIKHRALFAASLETYLWSGRVQEEGAHLVICRQAFLHVGRDVTVQEAVWQGLQCDILFAMQWILTTLPFAHLLDRKERQQYYTSSSCTMP